MRAGRLVVAAAIALLSGSGMVLGMVAGAIVGIAVCDRAQALSCAFWAGAGITFGAVLGAAATGEDHQPCGRL